MTADFEILSNKIFESTQENLNLANFEELGAVAEYLFMIIEDLMERMESVSGRALGNNDVSDRIGKPPSMNAKLDDSGFVKDTSEISKWGEFYMGALDCFSSGSTVLAKKISQLSKAHKEPKVAYTIQYYTTSIGVG